MAGDKQKTFTLTPDLRSTETVRHFISKEMEFLEAYNVGERLEKAVALLNKPGMVTYDPDTNQSFVIGHDNKTYKIKEKETCTCEDARYTTPFCKHKFAGTIIRSLYHSLNPEGDETSMATPRQSGSKTPSEKTPKTATKATSTSNDPVKEAVAQAEQACAAALDSTPPEYQRFLIFIKQSKRVGGTRDNAIYATIRLPYMGVDGRVKMAVDEHMASGSVGLEIETSFFKEEASEQLVCRALVKSPLRGVASGHSRVFLGGTGADATNPLENAECVPLHTEILTRGGFKFYHQVKTGDEVLTCNPHTGHNEWGPIERISVYEHQPVVKMLTSRFHATCTPQHKWIVCEASSGRRDLVPLTEIPFMKGNYKLVLSARESEIPEPFSPMKANDAARLGWLFSDGQLHYLENGLVSSGAIRQSKPENFSRLMALFGAESRECKTYNERWLQAREWPVPARKVRHILGRFGVNTANDLPQAVACMTLSEVESFYEAIMQADGYERGIGKCSFPFVESAQIACARLGIKTGTLKPHLYAKSTKEFYELPIHKTNGAYTSEIQVSPCPPSDVWCPTTKNGTWVARQDGQVWITGNTSAIGRALGFLGYGLYGTGIASGEEMVQAMINSSQQQTPETAASMKDRPPSDKQMEYIRNLLEREGTGEEQIAERLAAITSQHEASALIDSLVK